ncbi:MAG: aminotransferase class IV [Anaerolineae bacterium]
MSNFQLFAVADKGAIPLPDPLIAQVFADLYAGLALGVYSVWRTFDHNKFLHLDGHLARTHRSMAALGWDMALDETRIRRAIHEITSSAPFPEMRVRLDVLAEPATALGTESRVLLALQPFTPPPSQMYETGVRLDFAPRLHRDQPEVKTAAFAVERQALSGSAYEFLLLDEAGHILEGIGSNFYGVRQGAVWTAVTGVLGGITRQIILSLLPELGIPLHEAPVHRDELPLLAEAAMSSSSRALIPVVEIAGQRIGDGRPGPISRRILASYQGYVQAHVRTAV